jgi:hypothetical protein
MDIVKRFAALTALVLCAVLAWAGLAAFTPALPSAPADFYTLYSSVVAVSRGISPYDHAAVAQIQQAELGWDADGLGVPSLPYFYPPWYALLALPLAILPFRTAALAWFVISFLLLMASCLLVFRALGWRPGRWSLPLLAGAAFFTPTLLDLVVGQYGMPVLLGVCLVGSFCAERPKGANDGGAVALTGEASAARWRPALAGLGLVLLTFKPQLGIGALLVACVWLVRRQRLRPLVWALGLLLLLGAFSFRVSLHWPTEMITATASYAAWAGIPFPIQGCDTCSTFSGIVESAGVSGPVALLVDSVVVAGLLVALVVAWRRRGKDLLYLLSLACVATVLGTPYLRNYDLVILVLPFLFLLHSTVGAPRGGPLLARMTLPILLFAYVLPLAGTLFVDRLFVGRSGVVMAAALLALLLGQLRSAEVGR